jgi:hypothetical protein
MIAARTTIASAILLSVVALVMVSAVATHARAATEFSMEVSDFAGLNATETLGAGDDTTVISPSFTLKVRVENRRRVLQPWCCNGGEMAVSYSGVVLAWGHITCRASAFGEGRRHCGKHAVCPKTHAMSLPCVFSRGARQRAHGSDLYGKLPLQCAHGELSLSCVTGRRTAKKATHGAGRKRRGRTFVVRRRKTHGKEATFAVRRPQKRTAKALFRPVGIVPLPCAST